MMGAILMKLGLAPATMVIFILYNLFKNQFFF